MPTIIILIIAISTGVFTSEEIKATCEGKQTALVEYENVVCPVEYDWSNLNR